MPLLAEPAKARFTLTGPDCAPPDLGHHPDYDRRAYWRQLALECRDEKYRELHRGIDVNGARLRPRLHPRPDHARGPVLVPHFSDSRFRTSLRWAGGADGAVLWWKWPWNRIVAYHARGIPSHLGVIIRDVVGLTSGGLRRALARARAWWESRIAGSRTGDAAVTVQAAASYTAPVPVGGGVGSGGNWRKPPPRPFRPPSLSPPILAIAPGSPTIADFAARALAAAATVGPRGRLGERVFIAAAHAAYVRLTGERITLAEFKRRLIRAHVGRFLDLSPADLVQALDPRQVRASATTHPMGIQYHFLRLR